MPLKSDWSDSEEEEDIHEQNKEGKIKDWDSDLQNQKELEEQGIKNSNNEAPNQAQNSHPHLICKHSPHSPPKLLWTGTVI